MVERRRIIGYKEFGKRTDGSMNDKVPNSIKNLRQFYSMFNEIFDQCYNGKMNHSDICDINRRFFDFFNTVMKKEFIFKLSHKKPFDDGDRIGVKCFRVSINISNLMIDKYGYINEQLWSALFDCLHLFYPYSHSSKESRTITERILICLCRYYSRNNIPGNQSYALTDENRFCIELCFSKAPSEKIMVAAAIIICLSGSIDDDEELVGKARGYLRDVRINNSGDRGYLGIDARLIRAALSDDVEINPEVYQSKIINRMTKDEQIKETKKNILKKNNETDDVLIKNRELNENNKNVNEIEELKIGMIKLNEDNDNKGKKIEKLNTTISKLNNKISKEKVKSGSKINKFKKEINRLTTKLNKFHFEISKQTKLKDKVTVSLLDSIEKNDKLQKEIDELREEGQLINVNNPQLEDVGVTLQEEDGGSHLIQVHNLQ